MNYQKIFILVSGCLLLIFTLAGCSGGKNEDLQAGYYKEILIKPNGEFVANGKIDNKNVSTAGVVYKVELNDHKKVSKISTMYHEKLIDKMWRNTLNQNYGKFAAIAIEYQDGYIKYTFKDIHMQAAADVYGSSSIRYKLNKKNIATISYCYNKDGEQVNNTNGFAQQIFTYDDKGFLIKIGYANSNGERIKTKDGYYEMNLKYAKESTINSLPIEISNHGKDGSLLVNRKNIAKICYTYDQNNFLKEIRYYGSDENPKEILSTGLNIEGILDYNGAGAITKYVRDDKNNTLEISFYGKDEQPIGVNDIGNIASIRVNYDEDGNLQKIAFFGTDGESRAMKDEKFRRLGVAFAFSHDEYGNITKFSVLNKDGNLVSFPDSKVAMVQWVYSEKRELIEESYWGTSEEPIEERIDNRLFHKKHMEYDDDGKLVKTTYYDKEGNDLSTNHKNVMNNTSASLEEANRVLQRKNMNYKMSAVSSVDEDGFFGLLTGKGISFIIYDKKDDIIAMVDFDKKLLNPKENRYNDMCQPLIFKMRIKNANKDSQDKNLGSWSGSMHILPIYAQYKVNEKNEVVPGMLTSGKGENPSHYQGYLQEQSNVNLANLVLTHADSLRADIETRGISLP